MQRPPDPLGAHQLERLDTNRVDARLQPAGEEAVHPSHDPPHEDNPDREDERGHQGVDGVTPQRVRGTCVTIVGDGLPDPRQVNGCELGPLDLLHARVRVDDPHERRGACHDAGHAFAVDEAQRIDRDGRVSRRCHEPIADETGARLRRKRRDAAHAKQHGAVELDGRGRDLGLHGGTGRCLCPQPCVRDEAGD